MTAVLQWRVRVGGAVLGVAAVMSCLSVQAAHDTTAADQHRRGLLAYQRGDVAGAMAALRAPAQAGHAPSQSLLGFIFERADVTAEALRLWRDAAAQGDAEAHAGLANLYLTGRGVAKDEKAALRHFSEAAARGHAASTEIVALAWLQGHMQANAADDPPAARAALQRAAQQGHLPSADALVQAYRTGRYGLPVDEAEAAGWQARASTWRTQRGAAATPPAPAPAPRPRAAPAEVPR